MYLDPEKIHRKIHQGIQSISPCAFFGVLKPENSRSWEIPWANLGATAFAPIPSLPSWLVFSIRVVPRRAPIRNVANSYANDPHDQVHRFGLQQPRLRWRQQQRLMECSHGIAMEASAAQCYDDTKAFASAYIPRCSLFSRAGIGSRRRRHVVTRITYISRRVDTEGRGFIV